MPPNFCTSSVCSSWIASMTSSTVITPISAPTRSRRARRRDRSSRSRARLPRGPRVGETVTTSLHATSREQRALRRGEQLAQRHHAAQPALRRRSCRSACIASRRPLRAIARTLAQRLLHRHRLRRPRRTRWSSGRRRCPARRRGAAPSPRAPRAGISARISSARSSSSSSRTSARSSGVISVTSAAACAGRHRLEDLGAQLLVEVLEHVGRARRPAARARKLGDAARAASPRRRPRDRPGASPPSPRRCCRSFLEQREDVGCEQRGHSPHFVFARSACAGECAGRLSSHHRKARRSSLKSTTS